MNNNKIIENYLKILKINFEIKNINDISKLIKAHLENFSFSSLRVLLKEEISLDLNDIYENLVIKKRGGYCFEHNKLMFEVLKELGFNVNYFLARVINNRKDNPAQTHRFTLLEFEGEKYIVDVGIGFRSPSVPVKFGNHSTISHLNTEYKIIEFENKTFSMQLIEKGKPFYVTKFDLNTCYESDFELGNFYCHKNPNEVFVNNFVTSLIKDNIIHSLVNEKYFKITSKKIEEIKIESSKHLEAILKNDINSNFTLEEIEFFYEKYINKL